MTVRPRISELDRDDWNRTHIGKHGVTVSETEQVLYGNPVVRETYKGRFQYIGPTSIGRMLSVIVGPNPTINGLYYVFSARPASRKDRSLYDNSRIDE